MSEHNNPEDLDLSETESSSDADEAPNPIVYGNTQPLILELHDLRKDSDAPQNPPLTIEANADNPVAPTVPEPRVKRLRKKKKILGAQQQNRSNSGSSNTPTESGATVPPSVTDHTAAKEEFYDARESLHTLPENQQVLNPVVQAALAQAQSEHGPKTQPPAASQPGAQSATPATMGRKQTTNKE